MLSELSGVHLENLPVLLVDDDINTREILATFLAELGIKDIHQLPDAREAMTFIEKHHSWNGLVLCDWNMPYVSGASFYRQLRMKKPFIPFIMVSARNDEESILFAKDHDISAYLLKPVPFDEFERKIVKVVKASGLCAVLH